MELQIQNDFVAFSAARGWLRQLGVEHRVVTHKESASLAGVSLSDSQPVEKQIRFYTKQRIFRGFRSLAHQLSREIPIVKLRLDEECDLASREFFTVIGEQIAVELTAPAGDSRPANPRARLARIAMSRELDLSVACLPRTLARLLNIGDSWLASQLADDLREAGLPKTPGVMSSVAAAYNLQDRTLEAEHFYQRWADFGGLERARALYSLAMLFTRHHKPAELDHLRAKSCLEEAYGILGKLDRADSQIVYETVFNRNGIALLLFREGKLAEAAHLLETAIERLGSTPHSGGLHETVLQNNLGRVYSRMGSREEAARCHLRAIALDPNFPEYHLDFANHLLDQNELDAARPHVAEALRLDPFLPEALSMQGFVDGEDGLFRTAVEKLELAFKLGARTDSHTLNLAKLRYELEEWDASAAHLAGIEDANLTSDERAEMREIECAISEIKAVQSGRAAIVS